MSSDRPFAIYADGDPIGATPAIDPRRAALPEGHRRAVLMFRLARALARLARAASRRLGRSGGTTAPGRMLLQAVPERARGDGGRLDDGIGARVRHERQDHHRRDDRRRARARRARRSCTTGPGRTWPGAWPRRCSTPAASPARSGCSRSTRRGCRRWRATPTRGCCCCRTCSATSSTATASSSSSRTAGPSSRPSSTAARGSS